MTETAVVDRRAVLEAVRADARRRLDLAEARVRGLERAMVAETSVLWYGRDPELQRAFEEAFQAGRRMLSV